MGISASFQDFLFLVWKETPQDPHMGLPLLEGSGHLPQLCRI